MKKLLFMVMMASSLMLFAGCNKEQRCIDKLEKLVNKTEQKADQLDKEQWREAVTEYKEICAEMDKYNYTDEQMQEIGRLKGRFYALAAKYHLNGKGGFFNSIVQQGMGIIESLWGAADEELSNAIEGIKETMKTPDNTPNTDEDLDELNDWFE